MKIHQKKNRLVLSTNYKSTLIFFTSGLKWLSKLLKISEVHANTLIFLIRKIFKIAETRGKKEAIRYCKDIRTKFFIILFSNFKSTSTYPKVLNPIVRLCKSLGRPYIRLVLTTLYISRYFRLEPEPSYSSIEKAPDYSGNPFILKEDIHGFLKDLGINLKYIGRIPRSLSFKKYHISSKSGPNGKSMWNSFLDVKLITPKLLRSLKTIGGEKLIKNIMIVKKLPYMFDLSFLSIDFNRPKSLRKLALISDKEGKTREVAMSDYWTQTCLKPLHHYLFNLLRKIHQDCTFDQTKHITKLKTSKGSSFWSIDLSNATDRFPIDIQYMILGTMFGFKFANAWKDLMVGYPFDLPVRSKNSNRKITYMTGNPMGVYSSWSVFALSHHFLIWRSSKRAGIPWKEAPYMLLGDDVVISDDALANEYIKELQTWDIPFSKEKTHKSKYGYEFAKQIVFQNENVSPFPLAALYKHRNDLKTSTMIIFEQLDMKFSEISGKNAVMEYMRFNLRCSSSYFKKRYPLIELSYDTLLYLQGRLHTLGPSILKYVRYTNPSIPEPSPVILQIFTNEVLKQVLGLRRDLEENKNVPNFKGSNRIFLKFFNKIRLYVNMTTSVDYILAVPFSWYFSQERIMKYIKREFRMKKDPTIVENFSPSLYRDIYSPSQNPMSISDLYSRNREVELRTAWNLAKDISENALSLKSVRVMGKRIKNPFSTATPLTRTTVSQLPDLKALLKEF